VGPVNQWYRRGSRREGRLAIGPAATASGLVSVGWAARV
jgi:hypothetical protein